MPDDEGEALFEAALRAGRAGLAGPSPPTFVEIGAWCGKSTVYLGAAAEATGAVLLSVDHHRAPRRTSPGGSTTRPTWWTPRRAHRHPAALASRHRRRPASRRRGRASWATPPPWPRAGAARWPSASSTAGTARSRPGRTTAAGRPTSPLGGWLAIHDVFPDPADGGRPPYELFCAALDSGEFAEDGAVREPAGPAPGGAAAPRAAPSGRPVQPSTASPAVRLGQVQRGGQAFAAEEAGGRCRARKRVGGQHHGGEGVGRALAPGNVSSRGRPCRSSRSRRAGGGSGRP